MMMINLILQRIDGLRLRTVVMIVTTEAGHRANPSDPNQMFQGRRCNLRLTTTTTHLELLIAVVHLVDLYDQSRPGKYRHRFRSLTVMTT